MPRTILKGLQARIEAQKFLEMECVSQFEDEIEAAANLIVLWKIPRGLFVELWPKRRGQIDRAIAAVKDFRDVGVSGNPTKINKAESEILQNKMRDAKASGILLTQSFVNKEANEIIAARPPSVCERRRKPVVSSFAYDYEKRIENISKKRIKMKELDRQMAESKEELVPMFHRYQKLDSDWKYKEGLKFNFDEKPIRLSTNLSTILFQIDGEDSPAPVSPPRKKNATEATCISEDGDHLATFLLRPAMKVPEELKGMINMNYRIIAKGIGWMTKKILAEDVMPVWKGQMIEKRKLLAEQGVCEIDQHCLIICDSHSSRADIDMIKGLKKENIDVFTIHPHSSGACQPCDLGTNAQIQKHLDSFGGWEGIQDEKSYRLGLRKRLQDGNSAGLASSIVQTGFRLSGFSTFGILECLNRLPESPQLPDEIVKWYRSKQHRFGIGNQTLTDDKFLLKWEQHLNEMIEKKKNKSSGVGRMKSNKKSKKMTEDEEEIALKKIVEQIDNKMKILTKKNKRKKRRMTEEEVESMSEEDESSYYEDGYEFDSTSSDISEEDTDEFTELEDEKDQSIEQLDQDQNIEDDIEDEIEVKPIPQKRKRRQGISTDPIVIEDSVSQDRTKKLSPLAFQAMETEARWRKFKK